MQRAGQIRLLLRRDSTVASAKWRSNESEAPVQVGARSDPHGELKRLRENERLRSRLERAEHIIEVQKKLAELLGTSLNEIPSNEQR